MKVILLRDVAKIGRRGEVVEAPDGYALNQLIPKKWAEPATPANLKKIATAKAATSAQVQAEQSRFSEAIQVLSKDKLTVPVGEANEQGHLFKAVKEEDIQAAAKLLGVSLEKANIVLEAPIKSLGLHSIILKRGNEKVSCVIEVIKK